MNKHKYIKISTIPHKCKSCDKETKYCKYCGSYACYNKKCKDYFMEHTIDCDDAK